MQYTGTLIAVRDIDVSRRFYGEVLGLDAVADFGASVTLAGGLVLQTLETWEGFIGTDAVTLRSNAGELYFETEDIEAFCRRLEDFEIRYVHRLHEHPWGQRVIRFYDPDGHMIEAAERLDTVIRRFAAQGLTPPQTAEWMGVPVEFVVGVLNGGEGFSPTRARG